MNKVVGITSDGLKAHVYRVLQKHCEFLIVQNLVTPDIYRAFHNVLHDYKHL
jgi:hypothetical protein